MLSAPFASDSWRLVFSVIGFVFEANGVDAIAGVHVDDFDVGKRAHVPLRS